MQRKYLKPYTPKWETTTSRKIFNDLDIFYKSVLPHHFYKLFDECKGTCNDEFKNNKAKLGKLGEKIGSFTSLSFCKSPWVSKGSDLWGCCWAYDCCHQMYILPVLVLWLIIFKESCFCQVLWSPKDKQDNSYFTNQSLQLQTWW